MRHSSARPLTSIFETLLSNASASRLRFPNQLHQGLPRPETPQQCLAPMNNSLEHHHSLERKLSRQPTVAELGGAYGASLIAQTYNNYVPTQLCSKSGFEVMHDPVFNKVRAWVDQTGHSTNSSF